MNVIKKNYQHIAITCILLLAKFTTHNDYKKSTHHLSHQSATLTLPSYYFQGLPVTDNELVFETRESFPYWLVRELALDSRPIETKQMWYNQQALTAAEWQKLLILIAYKTYLWYTESITAIRPIRLIFLFNIKVTHKVTDLGITSQVHLLM